MSRPFITEFLLTHPNPSPPLPRGAILEHLAYWPQDTENTLYIYERICDLRELFLRVQEKWSEARMEDIQIESAMIQICGEDFGSATEAVENYEPFTILRRYSY